MGYPSDWDYIQNTYDSAPKSLGSMGYHGSAGVYVPTGKQKEAYSTAGLALQYFRDYNASWNQPWNFFASISAVGASLLAPCNKTGGYMASDAMLRRHVSFTGDLDGVIITNDTWRMCWRRCHRFPFSAIFSPPIFSLAEHFTKNTLSILEYMTFSLLRAPTLPDAMMASGGLPQNAGAI